MSRFVVCATSNTDSVRFQIFTAVAMKKAVFWDMAHLQGATFQKTAFFNTDSVHVLTLMAVL
jgi:hypothetical protein